MTKEYVTSAELAKQCNIDNVTVDEENYLTRLVLTATVTVENKIQQTLLGLEDTDGNIPEPLRQAILLIAANLYANREPVAYGVPQRIPYTLDYLVSPYIQYT